MDGTWDRQGRTSHCTELPPRVSRSDRPGSSGAGFAADARGRRRSVSVAVRRLRAHTQYARNEMVRSRPRSPPRRLAHVRWRSGFDRRRLHYADFRPTCWPAWPLVTNCVSGWDRAAEHVRKMPPPFHGHGVAHRIGRFCHASRIRLVVFSLLWSCDPLVFADWHLRQHHRSRVAFDAAASELLVKQTSPNKPAAGNTAIASRLTVGHLWPGVPEPARSAPSLRAERATLKSRKGAMIIAQGKRGTSARGVSLHHAS